MRIKMKNARYPMGEANVMPEDIPVWEAAGWVAVEKPTPKKSNSKKDDDQ